MSGSIDFYFGGSRRCATKSDQGLNHFDSSVHYDPSRVLTITKCAIRVLIIS
jgi:hypothetical protein